MTFSTIQWMVAGYTLAFAVALVSGGRLGDIFGRKKIFMGGMFFFMLASLASGLAPTAELLIAARLVQGVAAAMMMPQILANMVVLFADGKERLAATGMYGGIAGLATVGGPLIGGLLLENNLFGWSWRNIFFINIPVGIVSLLLAAKYLPESKSDHPLKVDWIGTFLLIAALLLLLFPLIQGRELGWPLWGYVMMASSAPLLVIFWFFEKFKTAKDGSPLVILDLFKARAFVAGIVIFIFFFGAMGAYFLLSTLFMQQGLGYTPLHAGLSNVPFSVGIALGAGLLVNLLMQRLGRLVLIIGAALLALGFAAWVVTLNIAGTDITSWDMVPAT
jgi:MFS family permease